MKLRLFPLLLAAVMAPAAATASVIVDDSFVDGRTNNGALQADWWTSTSSTAIETSPGILGLVSGPTSGRGIHGTFATQTLGLGETLTATFGFLTPATVGTGSAVFRVGLFNTANNLALDITGSPGTNAYNPIAGYMTDFDVNFTGAAAGTENLSIRERTVNASNLLSTTASFSLLAGGGVAYNFLANTAYTGVFSVTKTGTDTVDLTTSLFRGATQLSTFTTSDVEGTTSAFNVLAFHMGSGGFGSTGTVGVADNGIDFTNIRIETVAAPVPEPASVAMMLGGLLMVGTIVRRRRSAS